MVIKPTYLAALLAVSIGATGAAHAQQKIAYVATEAIMDKLPDAKSARAKLTELQSGWLREITRMEQEINGLRAEIQNNRLLWSVQEKRDAEARLADLESRLAQYRAGKFGPNSEFERKQVELMGPIVDLVAKAIDEEAKAQKYDYVMDKSSRGMPLLYANPQHDLTWAVLKRLGVDAPNPADTTLPTGRIEGDRGTEDQARRNRGRRDAQRPDTETPINPTDTSDPNKVLDNPSGGTGTKPE